ncbi:MAG: LLM class F420-dependent oxidoreductase [Acidimicrobiia bacterium]
MTPETGRFGAWRRRGEIDTDMARELEVMGFGAIWVGGSPAGDLGQIGELLDATGRIVIATGIVNMWREDAETVAGATRRLSERHPGRFLLGLGIGHRESTLEFRRPMEKMNEYLDRLDQASVSADQIVLAALGPRALRLSAERTAGAHPYLTTPRHTAYAREVLGNGPLLAPEQKVILGVGPDRARDLGRSILARYLRLSNYRTNLIREGWSEADLGNGGSDELVDSLVLHGGAKTVAEKLVAHLEAGADHVAIQVIGDDPLPAYRTLAGMLLD